GVDVGSLRILTSSPQIPSDGAANATITALVLDANNNVIANVPVILSASSGSLAVADPVTDESGSVTATLSTAGDPTNRAITVTGMAGDRSGSVTVNVIGTALTITGPSSLPLNGTPETFTVVLTNAGGKGIAGRTVSVSSALGNTLSQTAVTTDAQGRASVNVTATVGGVDTITASALGISTTASVAVSNVAFTFSAPVAGTEVPLNTPTTITVNYSQGGGGGVPGETIEFSTTRGTLSAGSAVTDGSGNASVTVTSTNAGPALLTA